MSSSLPPSSQIAERFQLNLSESWKRWFDSHSQELALPGAMRQLASVAELCADAPQAIWAGFMLPDSLPLVGNDYGDWICARVTEDNTLGELIYWYHGGGDWIPVGTTMAEAILHDAVDQFRLPQKQALRGASESRVEQAGMSLARLTAPELVHYLQADLPTDNRPESGLNLKRICEQLSQENYRAALDIMLREKWAIEAVTSDVVESLLQDPVRDLAQSKLAEELGLSWFPDFVRLLFDFNLASLEQREQVIASSDIVQMPSQNWSQAAEQAATVLQRRQDLGWATTIAGWALERAGQLERAAEIYWQGRFAPAFTDQAVRFNSHAIGDESKFAVARLHILRKYLPTEQQQDDYLLAFSGERSPLVAVQSYWTQLADQAAASGDSASAYRACFAAGWDMGVSRLSEYEKILSGLITHATACGWTARSAVAQAHQNCLRKSVGRVAPS